MRPSDLRGVLTVPAFTVCCMATAGLPACNELKQTKTWGPLPVWSLCDLPDSAFLASSHCFGHLAN